MQWYRRWRVRCLRSKVTYAEVALEAFKRYPHTNHQGLAEEEYRLDLNELRFRLEVAEARLRTIPKATLVDYDEELTGSASDYHEHEYVKCLVHKTSSIMQKGDNGCPRCERDRLRELLR